MNTETQTTRPVTITGTRGEGRWATLHHDDGTAIVTVYSGWGITDEVRLSGKNAVRFADLLAEELTSA